MVLSIKVTIDPIDLHAMFDEKALLPWTTKVVEDSRNISIAMMPNGPTPSKPNNPPAIQDGDLSQGLTPVVESPVKGRLDSTAPHGKYINDHGSPGKTIAPRPHLLPAMCKSVENNIDNLPKDLIKFGGRR